MKFGRRLTVYAAALGAICAAGIYGINRQFADSASPVEFTTATSVNYVKNSCPPNNISILSVNAKDMPDFVIDAIEYIDSLRRKRNNPLAKEREPLDSNRREKLGAIFVDYDVVGVQEAFAHPKEIQEMSGHSWASWPYFGETNQILGTIYPPLGTGGLLMLAKERPDSLEAIPFKVCSGDLFSGTKEDCLIEKASHRITIGNLTLDQGHLDSGEDEGAVEARKQQVDQWIERLPTEGPLVVFGDFNLKPEIPTEKQLEGKTPEKQQKMIERAQQDMKIMAHLLAKTGLTIAVNDNFDYILVRDVEVSNDKVIYIKGELTDHNALSANISWTSRETIECRDTSRGRN